MEPNPPNPPPVEAGSPAAPLAGKPAAQSAGAQSTADQRARWRAKYARQKARKLGVDFVPETPGFAPTIDRVEEKVASLVVLPWNPNTLLPLAEQLADSFERADIEGLKAKANKISPELVADVQKDAPWHPASKKALATSGSAIGAKWLAKMGIKEENAPEVVFCAAAAAILAGRNVLVSKLDKLILEMKKNGGTEKSEKEIKA